MDKDQAHKYEVLKKAVIRERRSNEELQKQMAQIQEERDALKKRVAEAEKAQDAARKDVQRAVDETESLRHTNQSLTKRVSQLQEELKAQRDRSAGWGLGGLRDMMAGRGSSKEHEQNYEVVVEELEHKIRESETLHAQIFDLKQSHMNQVDELKAKYAQLERKYTDETTSLITRLSQLEEELRIAKGEETRLTNLVDDRTQELGALQSQHHKHVNRLQQLEQRVAGFGSLIERNVCVDTMRFPSIHALCLRSDDLYVTTEKAKVAEEGRGVVVNIMRDVEALFANATERLHILLGRAAASGKNTTALRGLKDSLRRANTEYADATKALQGALQEVIATHSAHSSILSSISHGDDPGGLSPAPVSPSPQPAAEAWLRMLESNMIFVLQSLFVHTPTGGSDTLGEDERLYQGLSRPLAILQRVARQDGDGDMMQGLRLLKGVVKDVTETAAGLFARELKVGWELAGFDGVNKRISAALNSLYTRLSSCMELVAMWEHFASYPEPSPKVSVLPPDELDPATLPESVPITYLAPSGTLASPDSTRVGLHMRAARWLRRSQEVPLDVPRDEAPPRETTTPSPRPETPPPHPADPQQRVAPAPNGSIIPHPALQPSTCFLLQSIPDPCEVPATDQLQCYQAALRTADAKAVEFRLEWQRAVLDLEAKGEALQNQEQEMRELRCRLRNRETEVKNMSQGYSDQLKVMQDKIVDLQNRLAEASSRARAQHR